MLAQAGISARLLIVAGLVIGMVIAAYSMIDRDSGPQRKSKPSNHAVRKSRPKHEHAHGHAHHHPHHHAHSHPGEQYAAPRFEATLPPEPTVQPPTQTTGREPPAVAGPPRARLELETPEHTTHTQHAVHTSHPPSQNPPVYSTDSRNHVRWHESSDRNMEYRGAERSPRGISPSERTARAADSRRAPPTQMDPYTPGSTRRDPHADSRVRHGHPHGAGFRGTIHPAPYRN